MKRFMPQTEFSIRRRIQTLGIGITQTEFIIRQRIQQLGLRTKDDDA